MPSISVTTTFAAAADGQRFVILADVGVAESSPIPIRTDRSRWGPSADQ